MKISQDRGALANKQRFVQSLTRSRCFLNDDDFLKPIARTVHEDTSNTTQLRDSRQSRLCFDRGTTTKSSLFIFTRYLCERCTYAIAKTNGTNDYQFVVCATHSPAFPTNRTCTAFKLDKLASQ